MRIKFVTLGLLAILSSSTLAGTIDFYIGSTAKGKDGGIYLATLDENNGKVSTPKKLVELKGAGFQTLSPDGKFLLSTSSSTEKSDKPSGQLTMFSIQDDHSLKQTGEALIMSGGACHVSMDRSGKVGMFADYGSGTVGSVLIHDDGELGTLASRFQHRGSGPNPKRQRQPHAHSIYPGPDNRYAYAADLGTDTVAIYKIDTTTGKLTEAGDVKVPPGSGPRHMKFSKDSKRLYVLNELNTSISVFERRAERQLERVQDLSTLPPDSDSSGITCSEIRVHPNGRFVFAANRDTNFNGRDSLSVLQVKTDGSLTRLSTVPAGVSIPRNINLSPCGKWLITGGQKSNDLAVFAVDAETGTIKRVGANVPCPSPMCYVFLK